MKRPDYCNLFLPRKDNIPPTLQTLRSNVEYPNYNSLQYRIKPINRTPKIPSFHDCFDINKDGLLIFGCNDLNGRVWDSYVWGFEDVDLYPFEHSACLKIHFDSNITNLKYLNTSSFTVSLTSGTIELWSIKSKDGFPYCMSMIASKMEHIGRILGMDFLSNGSQLVTGCTKGLLKIWDINNTDVYSIHSFPSAHLDSITSISNRGKSELVFATCSSDRSALIWDYREQRPAIGLIENHKFDFTSIKWCNLDEGNNEMIYIGDAAGFINVIDAKMPKKILETVRIYKRPITKIIFNGSNMAVFGETNILRVYNNSTNLKFEVILTNEKAEHTLRDGLWNPQNLNELLVIGWDSKMHRHLIK